MTVQAGSDISTLRGGAGYLEIHRRGQKITGRTVQTGAVTTDTGVDKKKPASSNYLPSAATKNTVACSGYDC
jgi:hypothetical protein